MSSFFGFQFFYAFFYRKSYRWLCGLVFLFYACVCMAATPRWSWERELALEKEQVYQAEIAVGSVQKKLEFRWTLYKNQGLVMHIRYDKFNHQEVLYTDYQRNAFRVKLGRDKAQERYTPYLIIYFKEFKNKKAHFKLYIDGISASILSESISPSTESNKAKEPDRVETQNQDSSQSTQN